MPRFDNSEYIRFFTIPMVMMNISLQNKKYDPVIFIDKPGLFLRILPPFRKLQIYSLEIFSLTCNSNAAFSFHSADRSLFYYT